MRQFYVTYTRKWFFAVKATNVLAAEKLVAAYMRTAGSEDENGLEFTHRPGPRARSLGARRRRVSKEVA